MKRISKNKTYLLTAMACLALAGTAWARAGGAGDWSSSGGGDGGLIELAIHIIFRVIPFPYNFITLGVAGTGYYFFRKYQRSQSVYNSVPVGLEGQGNQTVEGLESFSAANAQFSLAEFEQRVRTAFVAVQEAWAAGNISPVRRYISDGVYQRFATQLEMMKLLKQRDQLEEIEVISTRLDRVESDGVFDILHVAIEAQMNDRFISEIDDRLNSGGRERFIEFWSFIRKKGAQHGKDMVNSNNCPNCGADLPLDMTDLVQCAYCKSNVNSGEYDFILAEITQAHDYVRQRATSLMNNDLMQKITALQQADRDFSPQVIEDKVSNGYLQVLTAYARQDLKVMRRFISDKYFAIAQEKIKRNDHIYNRLYLNEVELIGINELPEKINLYVYVRSSAQRVKLVDGGVDILDHAVFSSDEVVVLERDKKAHELKGSLYAHSCPNCSAPIADSLDTTCSYCDITLNSSKYDWVIDNIISLSTYQSLRDKQSMAAVKASALEKPFKIKDYVLNNILVVLAVDGDISTEEQAFVMKVAKKWGYKPEKIQGMMQEALAGRLSIMMPESKKSQQKIMKILTRAAGADNKITSEEEALLNEIEGHYQGKVN